MYGDDGKPNWVKATLDAGVSVFSADLYYQGEFLTDGKSLESQRLPRRHPVRFRLIPMATTTLCLSARVQDFITVTFCRQ